MDGDIPTSDPPTSQPRGLHIILVSALSGMVVGGLGVAAFTVDSRQPDPIALTIDTFPRELLGEVREDVSFRDAGSKVVVKRLDAQFDDQLRAYRFAYGGDGAQFNYGHLLALTVVNGRLAPAVPVAITVDSTDWELPTAVSLQLGQTSCVSQLPRTDEASGDLIFVDEVTGTTQSVGTELTWTECVLFDSNRNLSLRLTGSSAEEPDDVRTAASLYQEELERIHADLTD